ncbi:MAG TPA: hypothetical protein VFS43_26690 [Polyangiaceae bacterium]|nr:hypothetical protein [Polyangiaceae bacterium]
MSKPASAETTLRALFDAERNVRRLHRELVAGDRGAVIAAAVAAVREAKGSSDEDEGAVRLVRLAALLGDLGGDRAVDALIDVLDSEQPEARLAAGEALSELAFDRFKEVALGVERALVRLAPTSPALSELPFVLSEVPEPGVAKLLGRFLEHAQAEVVASAIEASVEYGDPALARLIAPLKNDPRVVDLDDEAGERDQATIGQLAREACEVLEAAS